MDDDHWKAWVERFRNGDEVAAREFWEQYGPLLQQVAANHMGSRLRMRIGPEDVVQSACRTFFRRAQAGQFQLDDGESLWRLLCVLTLTKVREQARYHTRQKRSMNRETHTNTGNDDSTVSPPLPDRSPSANVAVEFADQFEQLLGLLDGEERAIVDLKLQELTHDQVAERLGTSERTVRRVFKRVQSKLARTLGVPDSDRG